MPAELDKFYT